jgi:autoinducer 2-binding protein LuxP
MRLLTTTALMATTVFAGIAFADGHATLPLKELPGIADRDYWVPGEVNADGKLEALQATVGAAAVPYTGTQDAPLQIALVYPSSDTSDFWARNYLAMTKRLDELGVKYETTEFASRQVEHSLQTTYANQVSQDADLYDYVIFGPSELAIQADNINTLSGNDNFDTYVWAFHTPLK